MEENWWDEEADRLNRICESAAAAGATVGSRTRPPTLNPDGSLAVDGAAREGGDHTRNRGEGNGVEGEGIPNNSLSNWRSIGQAFSPTSNFDPEQERDETGRWTRGGAAGRGGDPGPSHPQ
jgi:hypothetical protein